jgi:hypothetical protein
MELDPVHEGVISDRTGMRGALAQGLEVNFAGSPDVLGGDGGEGKKFDQVYFDLTRPDPVAASLANPRLLPQPDRKRDVSGQDVIAQLRAELHTPDATWISEGTGGAGRYLDLRRDRWG